MFSGGVCNSVRAAVVAAACAVGGSASAGVILSDFDGGLDGWVITNTVGAQWIGAGGNPGGYAHIDNTEQQIAYMFAPGAFLGDLSAFNGGTIAFDAIQLGGGGDPWDNFENFGRMRIQSGGLVGTADLVDGTTGPAPEWTTYSAPMTAAAWGLSEADWATLLSNVTEISLSVEGLFGLEVNGVDNFRIVPAPSVAWLLTLFFVPLRRRRMAM